MTQSISVAEIQAAGGLKKWMGKAAQPAPVRPGLKPREAMLFPLRKASSGPAPVAKCRLPQDRLVGYDMERMNGLEARYAGRLEALRRAGKIAGWQFEAVKLRLADGTFYTPDFFIMLPNGLTGFHETKGFWRDDARAKIKIAAELFPWWFFVAVQWDGKAKEWKFERFRAGGQDQ